MIDTHVYQLKANLQTSNLDENGRHTLAWQTIHVQVKKDTLEYSFDKKRAYQGDYNDTITH